MKTILYLRYKAMGKSLIPRLAVICIAFYGHSQRFDKGNLGFVMSLIILFEIPKLFQYILPVNRKDKFLASAVESLGLMCVVVPVTLVASYLLQEAIVSYNLVFFALLYPAVYNLIVTAPPALNIKSGGKFLMVGLAVMALIGLLIFVNQGVIQGIAMITWFGIFYAFNYYFYNRLGHEKGAR